MDIINKYLEEFKKVSYDWFKDTVFIKKYFDFFQNFIKKENLQKAEWQDFQEMGDNIHSFNSLALAKKRALGKPNHPIEHYRNSFIYLAYGKDDIETRLNNFLYNDKYRIKFFGESAVSEILVYIFPNDFVFFNARIKFALKLLNINSNYKRGDKFPQRYIKVNKAIKPIIEKYKNIVGQKTDMPIDIEVDQFFSYLYETYKGKVPDYENPEELKIQLNYWLFSPGEKARLWDDFYKNGIMGLGWDFLGDYNNYSTKDEIQEKMQEHFKDKGSHKNDVLACFDFTNTIKKDDIIFVKSGINQIVGYGIVTSNHYYDNSRKEYKNIINVEWIDKGSWKIKSKTQLVQKTLTDITRYKELITELKDLVGYITEEDEDLLPTETKNHWWLNANPKIWDLAGEKVGATQTYTSYNEKGNKRRVYKHFEEVKKGDLIIGYVSTPDKEIVSICEITQGLYEDEKEGEIIEFKKIEQLKNPVSFQELQDIPDLKNCEPIINNQGSLFKLTEDEYDIIRTVIDEKNPLETRKTIEKYTIQDALGEIFLEEKELKEIIKILKRKKNIILQGPPGVGKSFIAKRLAYLHLGKKNENNIKMVQFHQSYSYEDFIQGYRPSDDKSFILKNGVFYDFCKRAQLDSENDYFFIIDEINRGNLSKIFGETMMLIEADKRGMEFAVSLTYSKTIDDTFYIPKNIYLIGTMNTADRSLALVDFALRRRFSFIDLVPQFKSKKFYNLLEKANIPIKLIDTILEKMNYLNEKITSDKKNLGQNYTIGHSYFCPDSSEKNLNEDWYKIIINYEIEPLIREYWFDDEDNVDKIIKELLNI